MPNQFVIKDNDTGKYFIETLPFIGSPFYGKKSEAMKFHTIEEAQNKINLLGEQKTNIVEPLNKLPVS